jgi:hypothetical protein
LLLTKTLFFREKISGIYIPNSSIVMEYMDKGDLYQAITEKKKKRDVYFEEK